MFPHTIDYALPDDNNEFLNRQIRTHSPSGDTLRVQADISFTENIFDKFHALSTGHTFSIRISLNLVMKTTILQRQERRA
jgi:hypothetical protein